MTIGERLRVLGDDVSYRFPKLRKYLKPIWHLLFLNRYNQIKSNGFSSGAVDAIKVFDKCMVDNGISYSLAFGSILGAIREKGIIKHDRDMDTYVFADEDPAWVRKCLQNAGFRLTREFLIDSGQKGREETYEYNNCPIDIYWVYNDDDGGYCCSSFFPYGDFPTERISMRKVGKVQGLKIKLDISRETKRVPFGDLMLPIPANAEEFLAGYYGENYMTPDPNWSWRTCPKILYWNDAIATYDGVE